MLVNRMFLAGSNPENRIVPPLLFDGYLDYGWFGGGSASVSTVDRID